jgi:hypothetical protein
MNINFLPLDAALVEALAKSPLRLVDISEIPSARDLALRLHIRRSGESPSRSADKTINHRLQALRRDGKIAYDRATARWEVWKT